MFPTPNPKGITLYIALWPLHSVNGTLLMTHCKRYTMNPLILLFHGIYSLIHSMTHWHGVYSDTPSIKGKKRAFEIESFLQSDDFQRHYVATKWCAVDDLPLQQQYPQFMKDHFIRTNYRTGITAQDAVRAVSILNEEDQYSNSYDYWFTEYSESVQCPYKKWLQNCKYCSQHSLQNLPTKSNGNYAGNPKTILIWI